MYPTVHPALIHRWKRTRLAAACCVPLGCDPHAGGHGSEEADPGLALHGAEERGEGLRSGAFGVRRPLRFLAYKLDLTEPQMVEMARLLDDLKTERAQAAVDERRTLAAFADAVAGETFDAARAGEAAGLRNKSGDRLSEAVVRTLGRIHQLLDAEQRARFAYLIRTGALAL